MAANSVFWMSWLHDSNVSGEQLGNKIRNDAFWDVPRSRSHNPKVAGYEIRDRDTAAGGRSRALASPLRPTAPAFGEAGVSRTAECCESQRFLEDHEQADLLDAWYHRY
jgi:hypothetical protein